MIAGGGTARRGPVARALFVLAMLTAYPVSGEPTAECVRPAEHSGYSAESSCNEELHPCPVVTDRRGDAGLLRRFSGRLLVEDQPALDIVSSGAETSLETMTMSVRVDDLTARPPAGFTMTGWTVSWSEGRVRRFAQAERVRSRVAFRYGIARGGARKLAGPSFGGIGTAGEIDPEEGLIRIQVPRLPGEVEDGSSLTDFGAVSWLARSGTTIASFRTVDRTDRRSYHVGRACGA